MQTSMSICEKLNVLPDELDEQTHGRKTYRGYLGYRPVICRTFDKPEDEDEASEFLKSSKKICHPNILNYIGETIGGNQKRFFVFDSYHSSLRTVHQAPAPIKIRCFSSNKILELQLKDNDLPSFQFQTIVREIIKGVKFLQLKCKSLRKVKSSNVAIGITESGELLVKLMGVIIKHQRSFEDFKNVALIIKDCMNQQYAYTTSADDFVSKICKLHSNLPFGLLNKDKLNTSEAVRYKIFETPEILFKHPFFWSSTEYMSFMYKAGELNRIAKHMKDPSHKKNYQNFLAKINAFANDDWRSKLPEAISKKINAEAYFDFEGNYSELLRLVRNNGIYYPDQPMDTQMVYGVHPDGFVRFFNGYYPGFIMHVYITVEEMAYSFRQKISTSFFDEFFID